MSQQQREETLLIRMPTSVPTVTSEALHTSAARQLGEEVFANLRASSSAMSPRIGPKMVQARPLLQHRWVIQVKHLVGGHR